MLPAEPGIPLLQALVDVSREEDHMPWIVENPLTMYVEMSYSLFNATKASDLPAPEGHWGINNRVWNNLIDLTRTNCAALNIPMQAQRTDLKGLCIWASVVAAKFYVHKFRFTHSHVVRVKASSDHYFVVAANHVGTVICDITCNQFGGPDFIVGTLRDIASVAKGVKVGGLRLYDAYALGARTKTFVV